MRRLLPALFFLGLLAACGFSNLDSYAQRYVKLGLELGQFDPDYVDAYLGPKEWAQQAKTSVRTKTALAADIAALLNELESLQPASGDEARRHGALLRNVRAMDTRIRMVNGETFSFSEEASRIYDVQVPDYEFDEFDRILIDIDALLPGEGDLAARVDAFRNTLVIPDDKIEVVFNRAIDECRQRTAKYIILPASETFTLEYVKDQAWSGYNWYQGNNESLMQINLDFPVQIDAAVRLGCHEGYPGHHVWNVLVENQLVIEKDWIEHALYPLFSPAALIGEGSANYGVQLAFPGKEKIDFERAVLFPLAGLDPALANTLDELNQLSERLSHSTNLIARQYLDGKLSRNEAIALRRKYGLTSIEKAEQRIRFIEKYRSYVVNYTLGKDIVKAYVEAQANTPSERWQAFEQMLTELVSASQMTDK